jgi:hypothetical protein
MTNVPSPASQIRAGQDRSLAIPGGAAVGCHDFECQVLSNLLSAVIDYNGHIIFPFRLAVTTVFAVYIHAFDDNIVTTGFVVS